MIFLYASRTIAHKDIIRNPKSDSFVLSNPVDGFFAILQVDGYAGYNRLLNRDDCSIKLAYCWTPARRKLHEDALNATAPIAEEGLKRIAAIYRIEANIRGQNPDACLSIRQELSTPRLADFEIWIARNRTRVSGNSPLGEALKHIAKYWDGLCLFRTDSHIEMDNNPSSGRSVQSRSIEKTLSSRGMTPAQKTGASSPRWSKPAISTASIRMPT